MEKPRTIIKKYTIPILFNYQDSKLWIITGCGKVSKIAIPKNEYCQDQKRCIPFSKGLLEGLFSDGYSNNELTEKILTVSTTEKLLPIYSKIIKLITNI